MVLIVITLEKTLVHPVFKMVQKKNKEISKDQVRVIIVLVEKVIRD